jgi:protocatechuate 3,4-dioxygenase beta subunit
MNKITLNLIMILTLYQSISLASVEVDPLIAKCHITPKVNIQEYRPKEFNSNNNLRRFSSSMITAQGEPIIIAGRVMDKNCIPVMGATLKLWQRNSFGSYPQNNLSSKLNDPNFVGNGTSYTDNLGRFSFLTILPGATKNSLPNMNIVISHDKLRSLTTKIFFDINGKITSDNILKNMSLNEANKLIAQTNNELTQNNEKIYYIDLVLNDALTNKSY